MNPSIFIIEKILNDNFFSLEMAGSLASAEVFLRISKIIRDLFDELMSNFQMCMEEL